jgi:3-oxoacyl-[acyl-carrier protein] reductase
MLKDRVALVTGAATGIGEAVARLFAEHGARVFLLDRDQQGVEAVAASIPEARAFAGDVRETAALARPIEAAMAAHGRFDILINNAGIYPRARFLDLTDEQWDEMQDINLKSMFHSMQLALPHMIRQRAGKIVNISSVTFHLGMSTLTHYVASKGGVIGLTRSVAREMGEHNVHVNCITPGAIKTEAEARVVTEQQAREFLAHQSLQRRLMPLDVARVCLFLASELSDGMTGQCLNVDAGWVMY